MPMIDFDRLAKSNGVGWSQESVVVALCAEIGQLRLRIRAVEAVAHAPVALPAPPPPPEPSDPSEEAKRIAWSVLQIVHDAEYAKLTWGQTAALIAVQAHDLVARTRQDERERAARAICPGCAAGTPLVRGTFHEGGAPVPMDITPKGRGVCRALAIRGGGK